MFLRGFPIKIKIINNIKNIKIGNRSIYLITDIFELIFKFNDK